MKVSPRPRELREHISDQAPAWVEPMLLLFAFLFSIGMWTLLERWA